MPGVRRPSQSKSVLAYIKQGRTSSTARQEPHAQLVLDPLWKRVEVGQHVERSRCHVVQLISPLHLVQNLDHAPRVVRQRLQVHVWAMGLGTGEHRSVKALPRLAVVGAGVASSG